MTERTTNGKFKKGVSGNPSGRPKSIIVDAETQAQLGDDPVETLRWLLRSAVTRKEKRQAALDLIEYVTPKLKSIQMQSKEEKHIVIEWLQPGLDEQERLKEIKDAKLLEHNELLADLSDAERVLKEVE